MKTTRNIIGLIAITALIVIAIFACGGGTNPICDHTFGAWTTKNAANCTKAEEQERTCSKCPVKETQFIGSVDPNAHDWQFVEGSGTPATCTTAGSGTETCKRNCGVVDKTGTINPLTHDLPDTWTVHTPARCEIAGEERRTCRRTGIGCTHFVWQSITALVHNWGSWTVTIVPTPTDPGERTRSCSQPNCPTSPDVQVIPPYTQKFYFGTFIPIGSQPGVGSGLYAALDIENMVQRLHEINNMLLPPYIPGPPITEGGFSVLITETLKIGDIPVNITMFGYIFFISPVSHGIPTILNQLNYDVTNFWSVTMREINGIEYNVYFHPQFEHNMPIVYTFRFN